MAGRSARSDGPGISVHVEVDRAGFAGIDHTDISGPNRGGPDKRARKTFMAFLL